VRKWATSNKEGETVKSAIMAVGVCLIIVHCAASQAPTPTRSLAPSSIRDISVPPFTSWGNAACDKEGNMYFHVGGSSDTEILRLSPDANEGRTFKNPKAVFADFSVTPAGEVYVLAGLDRELKLLRFDDDNPNGDQIPLHLPQGVNASNIVASDNRTLLFFGFHESPADPKLKGKGYAALIDTSSGAVRQELHITVPGVDIAKLASGAAIAPGAALGDDGNFYLAGSGEILVLDEGGEFVRRIPFDNPQPKSVVSNLQVSGGLIILTLSLDENHQVHMSYLVLLSSGATVGHYMPSEQLGEWGETCYSPRRGMTFLKVDNHQIKLLTAQFP